MEVRVFVVNRGRKYLYMRYIDPVTGKLRERSTGTRSRKEAERAAAVWQAELREGRCKAPSKVSWVEFRHRYEDEALVFCAKKTQAKVASTFKAIEEALPVIRDGKLAQLTADRISYLQSELRKPREIPAKVVTVRGKPKVVEPARTVPGLSDSTIRGHLRHLKAALNWAHRMKMLTEVPQIEMPKRARGAKDLMKGRPITGEEFERMLAAVPKVVVSTWKDSPKKPPSAAERKRRAEYQAAVVESWRRYLRGLWWSGLRLEESLELYWDLDNKLQPVFDGKRPKLRIPGDLEKGNRDRLLPIAPEFAEFLEATPAVERSGPIFDPLPRRETGERLKPHRVCQVVSAIGEAAGVKVRTDARTGRVKYASAHDLRRSFGDRWAARVMPRVLMILMRHESIETTMRYYVERDMDSTADALWDALPGLNGATGDARAADSSSVVESALTEAIDNNGLR